MYHFIISLVINYLKLKVDNGADIIITLPSIKEYLKVVLLFFRVRLSFEQQLKSLFPQRETDLPSKDKSG